MILCRVWGQGRYLSINEFGNIAQAIGLDKTAAKKALSDPTIAETWREMVKVYVYTPPSKHSAAYVNVIEQQERGISDITRPVGSSLLALR